MPQKALVVFLAVLALVVGGWLALAGGGSGGPVPPTAPVRGSAPADASLDPAAATGGPPAAAGNESAADPARVAVGPEAGAGAAAAVAVRGRLVDRAQKPRAGVELRLATWGGPDLADLDLPLGRPGGDQRLPKAVSDAEGRFRFALQRSRTGQLHLSSHDLVFRKGEIQFAAKGDVDLGDVEVLADSRIAGVVLDSHGQPVADVKVAAAQDALVFGERSQTTTDARGRFEIAGLHPATWHLRTASGKFLPTEVQVAIGVEEHKSDVELRVAPGSAIAGQVIDDRGIPVADIKVGSNRKESRGELAVDRFSPDEATRTDKNGYFQLDNLQGDAVSVRAFGKGYAPAAESHVAVGTGNVLLRVQRLATIAGVLRDTAGRPIAGSRVSTGGGGGPTELEFVAGADGGLPFGPGGGASATTGDDGSFRIEGVRPGNVTVRARGKTHRPAQSQPIALQPSQTVEGVAIVAEAGAIVRAHVSDAAGKPVADAKVVVKEPPQPPAQGGQMRRAVRIGSADDGGDVRVFGGDEQFGSGTTDAAGDVEIAGLPAGSAVVVATHASLAESVPASVALPASGAVEVKVALREPGFADVAVARADGMPADGASVAVHGPLGAGGEDREHTARAGADGRARIGPLPPGDYRAELQLDAQPRNLGGAKMFFGGDRRTLRGTQSAFHVDAGQSAAVALRLPVLARVHGTVAGSDGPAAAVAIELEREREPGAADADGGPPAAGGQQTQTAADGSYAIDDVEPGRYRLRFGKPDQLTKASEPLVVAEGAADVQKDLALRFGKLAIKVVDKLSGEGVEGAEIELQAQDGVSSGAPPRRERRMMMISMSVNQDGEGNESTTMTMGGQRKKTDVDGTAEIDDVPAGIYTVRVRDSHHATREMADQVVTENATTNLGRVELEAAGRIRGRVLDADGKQVGMALVTWRKADAPAGSEDREPAIGGTFTLNGLSPGRYKVRAQQLGPGEPVSGPEVEVEVAAGKVAGGVELRVPAQH